MVICCQFGHNSVELGKIQPTRADNPERRPSTSDVTKRAWINLGYPKNAIIGSNTSTAANVVTR
eukprot:1537134-Ditylum_brightwellii.AAC.1